MADSEAHQHLADYIIEGADEAAKSVIFLKSGVNFEIKDAWHEQGAPGMLTCKLVDDSHLFVVVEEIAALVSKDPD